MDKNNIKIFVSYKDKHKIIKSDIITPIQTGRAIADEIFEDMIGDDTGDNISAENDYYSELSAQYWVWKNYEKIGTPNYIGFMHYRRHFIFNEKYVAKQTNKQHKFGYSAYGFENLDDKYFNDIQLNDEKIENTLLNTDIIFIKKANAKYLGCKNGLEDFKKNCIGAHEEDYYRCMEIVEKLYPNEFTEEIKELNKGPYRYFYNMFIMKKEYFFKYSEFLFSVLKELKKELDTEYDSRNGYRVLGYMGEFLLSLYAFKMNKTKSIKIKELYSSFLFNTKEQEILKPAFQENFTTIAMSSSNEYAPYLAVCLQSLIDNSSKEKNYDIVILEKDISEQNKKLISQLSKASNISIRFYNCKQIIETKAHIDKNTHYREECVYRLYAAEIFKNYEKIIFTDCDLLFLKDISLLNSISTDEHPIAACMDYMMNAMYNINWADWKQYSKNILKLKNIYSYCNTGVMIINTNIFKNKNICPKCLNLLETSFLRILEQDALNMVLQDDVKYIPSVWNVMTLQEQMKHWKFLDCMSLNLKHEYLSARNNIHILHYAATRKPWYYPDEEFADIWWQYARKTPFYEIILKRMCDKNKPTIDLLSDIKHYRSNVLRYWKYKILQNFVFGKTRERYTTKKYIFKTKIRNAKAIR